MRNSLFSLVDENNISENKSCQKQINMNMENEKKSKLIVKEPNILFQAHYEPNNYSKLLNSTSLNKIDNVYKSIEERQKREILNGNLKKDNLFKSMVVDLSKNYEENEFFTTINPEIIIKKKLILTKQSINNEMNYLEDFYKKTKNTNLPEKNYQYTNRKSKSKNVVLPYIFISQQFLKKSKSMNKLKVMHKSMNDIEHDQEFIPGINNSLKKSPSIDSTILYEKYDISKLNQKQSILNKELKKKISQVRSSYFSILSHDKSKK